MRQAFDRQIESTWAEKAAIALKQGNQDAYRLASVNHRVYQVVSMARRENWSSWKSRSVCKYIQKTFESMTIAELSAINDRAVEELIDHAAAGFDRHTRRAGR